LRMGDYPMMPRQIMIEMSATEAREFGIPVDQRQRYYRLDPVDAPRPPGQQGNVVSLAQSQSR
jgi:hypothetical protein